MNNNMEKKVINGAFSLLLSSLIVKLLSLIYKIPLSYILSDEGMGYFNSAYTVYTFFYIICTAGIPKAISIIIARAESAGEHGYSERIYKTALAIFSTLGSIITLLFIILSGPISVLIGNSAASFTMVAIAPSILFVCASGVIRGYFNGILEFLPIAVSEIISGVAKLALGILFVNIGNTVGFDLPILSALTILGITLGSFIGYIYLAIYKKSHNRCDKTEQISTLNFKNGSIIKEIFKIAIPITAASAIGSVGNIIDLSVIMHRLKIVGYTELQSGILYGNYTTLSVPMLNLLGTFIAPLSCILLPIISKNEHENNKKDLSSHISISIKTACFFAVPAAFIFYFNAYEILEIIFENTSAAMAAPLLKLLAPGAYFMTMVTVLNTAFEGMGKTKIPLISLSIATIVKLAFTFIFVGNEKFGVLGAPIATSLSYVCAFLISVYFMIVKEKIPVKIFLATFQTFIASSVSILASSAFIRLFSISGTLCFIVKMFIFALSYLTVLLLINFYKLTQLVKISKMYKKNIL